MGGPTPELDVADLDRSLAFYVGVIGFGVMFDRPEERFAFLTLEGVHLMLEEAAGPGRRFRTAPLEHPYGRGVNFMIEVAEIDRLHSRVQAAGFTTVIPLEERWYRLRRHSRVGGTNEVELGHKQFVQANQTCPKHSRMHLCTPLRIAQQFWIGRKKPPGGSQGAEGLILKCGL
jgi:catechol 2,3-dioxygenase-like lactoylglutathione lyase family enzyme